MAANSAIMAMTTNNSTNVKACRWLSAAGTSVQFRARLHKLCLLCSWPGSLFVDTLPAERREVCVWMSHVRFWLRKPRRTAELNYPPHAASDADTMRLLSSASFSCVAQGYCQAGFVLAGFQSGRWFSPPRPFVPSRWPRVAPFDV